MNDDKPHDQNEMLMRLLRIAGARQPVPAQTTTRVKSAVHDHWKRNMRIRQLYRTILIAVGAVAVSLGAFVLLRDLITTRFLEPVPVGIVELVRGTVLTSDDQSKNHTLTRGGILMSGSRLASDRTSQTLVRFLNGLSLRMDVDTELRIKNANNLELLDGAIYLDCAGSHSPVTLLTSLGTVHDNGTQFEVRLQNQKMRIMVREGSVLFVRKKVTRAIGAGQQITVDEKGSAMLSSVSSYGPHWNWISDLTPAFAIEGKSLADYLRWVTREMGWRVQFSHPRIENAASRIILHGTITGVPPQETPGAVLPICGLEYVLQNGILTITPPKGFRNVQS